METKRYINRLRKDHAEVETEWQLYANRLKNDKADAMRDMDRNRREELVELARLRKEAAERAAELDGALTREREASRRVRDMRGGTSWLEERRTLESERDAAKQREREAKARRTLNQRRLSEASLDRQRAAASTAALHRDRSHLEGWWRDEEVAMADEGVRQASELQAEIAKLQIELEQRRDIG